MDEEIQLRLSELLYLQKQVLTLIEHLCGKIEVEDEWLDNNDLCRLFKVTDKTIYRWRKQGLLKPYMIGGKCYYSKKKLSDFIAER